MQTIKDRIKEICKYYKLNQEEFGEKIGVSRYVIVNIELDRVEPKELIINHICDIYSVNKEWLLTGNGSMLKETKNTLLKTLALEYDLDDIDVSIIKNYMELSKGQRKNFVTLLKALANTPDDKKSYTEKMEQVSNELLASEKAEKYTVSTTINTTNDITNEKIS